MKEIIKGGIETKFDGHCLHCGCDFTFQIEDTYYEEMSRMTYIITKCPYCDFDVRIPDEQAKILMAER